MRLPLFDNPPFNSIPFKLYRKVIVDGMSRHDSVAVFLGPSLPQSQARKILEASYYPPARKGDVYRVMASGVETIVLIDGVFHNTPSVWQRELLDAIEEDFLVFGASSMGALRAAELCTLGMTGHGVVFEWYRDGVIEGDDEVALLHATEEFNYRPFSVPMVTLRYTLARAVADRCLTIEQHDNVLSYLKSLPYPNRSFRAVLHSPALRDAAPEVISRLELYLAEKAVDIKMQDAVGLLRHVKSVCGQKKSVAHGFQSRTTAVSKQQYERVLMTGFHTPHGIVEGAEILRRAQEDKSFVERIRPALSLRRFILEWINQNRLSCPDNVRQAALDNFESNHNSTDFAGWLRKNGLTYPSFTSSLAELISVDWVIMKGPAHFGLDWPSSADSIAESLFAAVPQAFPYPLVLKNLPRAKRIEQTTAAALYENSSYSQYRFISDWADRNGISVDDLCLETESGDEEKHNRVSPEASPSSIQPASSSGVLQRELLLAHRVVERGPEYFGLDWVFELDLLRVLQITDQVERFSSQEDCHRALLINK